MWLYVTESRTVAERVLTEVLTPLLKRPIDVVRNMPLPVGPAEVCAERLAGYAEAGAQRVYVWPLADELRQLELFREHVTPLIP